MTQAISIRMMTAASSMEAFRSANAVWKNPHPPEKQHAAKKSTWNSESDPSKPNK